MCSTARRWHGATGCPYLERNPSVDSEPLGNQLRGKLHEEETDVELETCQVSCGNGPRDDSANDCLPQICVAKRSAAALIEQ